MEKKVYFRPRARIMSQLGDQLIKNESIALNELVKNSYDADAKKVTVTLNSIDSVENGTIIVKDNGDGMDYNTVANVWMEPGTDWKRQLLDKMIEEKRRSKLGRLPIGEKGIGRFGVHKLGNYITLITRSAGCKEIVVTIDWNSFENASYLNDVPIKIIERVPIEFIGRNTGTKIVITDLKRPWTRGMLRDAFRSIQGLNSPFESNSSFKIKIVTDKSQWTEGLLSIDQYKEYALFEASGELEGSKIINFRYKFKPWEKLDKIMGRSIGPKSFDIESYRINEETGKKDKIKLDLSTHQIGKVTVKLLMYDLDSQILAYAPDKRGLRDFLKQNGGMYVYRDNVRLNEYGEAGNDWLELDSRRINRPSFTISSSLMIGAVYLDRFSSGGLKEKTNREGFIENEAYDVFKDAVFRFIEKVEAQRLSDKQDLRKYYSKNKSIPIVSAVEDIKQCLMDKDVEESVKKEILGALKRIEKDYKYISDIYIRSASSGLSLSIVIHEVEKILAELKYAVQSDAVSVKIRNLVADLAAMTDGYSDILRSNRKKNSDLKNVVSAAVRNCQYRFRAHNVEIFREFDEFDDDCNVKCSENLILGILMNLFDNSIWWTKDSRINPKIFLNLTREIDGYISIIIADNGKGFSLEPEQMIKPFVTDKPGGMGLGLHLADEIMKAHGGLLMFPDYGDIKLPRAFNRGAAVALCFRIE